MKKLLDDNHRKMFNELTKKLQGGIYQEYVENKYLEDKEDYSGNNISFYVSPKKESNISIKTNKEDTILRFLNNFNEIIDLDFYLLENFVNKIILLYKDTHVLENINRFDLSKTNWLSFMPKRKKGEHLIRFKIRNTVKYEDYKYRDKNGSISIQIYLTYMIKNGKEIIIPSAKISLPVGTTEYKNINVSLSKEYQIIWLYKEYSKLHEISEENILNNLKLSFEKFSYKKIAYAMGSEVISKKHFYSLSKEERLDYINIGKMIKM